VYIQITVDLKHYNEKSIELRLSDQHLVKNLVAMTWQTARISRAPREGFWVRVKNKDRVWTGTSTLEECGITTGDCIEIL
jgi:uncharacterized ubiquitin-like protein YukD